MNKVQKIVAIIGARPQFIKHYPFEREALKYFDLITIHTGQHYDQNMSQVFFDQLGMKKPGYMLSLGGGSHGEQTGKMLIEIEKILLAEKPNMVVVYGDTNSTLAGSLAASKLHIPVAHIEAGLRSYNKKMPEEVNRIMTDHVSDLLLVPSQKSVDNLRKEGIEEGVNIVGDIMKDMIQHALEGNMLKEPSVSESYYYITLHRPYNVDDPTRLQYVMDALSALEKEVVFSAHPRTQNRIKEFNISLDRSKITIIDPQPYFENLSHLYYSEGLVTDSGGMQKEAYWLKKKCITIRTETEWVETLEGGANELVFENLENLNSILDKTPDWNSNLYGNGKSSEIMVDLIKKHLIV